MNSTNDGHAGPTLPRTYVVVHGRAYYLSPAGALMMAAPLTSGGAPDFAAAVAVDFAATRREEVALREIERLLFWISAIGAEGSLSS